MYSGILNIARSEKAVCDGTFFDLMYVNSKSDVFEPYRQYAFMRKYKNEVLFVVVNFSDKDAECGVKIPRHAIDYMQLPENLSLLQICLQVIRHPLC